MDNKNLKQFQIPTPLEDKSEALLTSPGSVHQYAHCEIQGVQKGASSSEMRGISPLFLPKSSKPLETLLFFLK
jgi:hypothetical protein